ncbi:MAG TPA: putative glycoside hydrolase [Solirubrobacterales bacterium]|nr:putative glycoside hydrolase [Solirubrobacterales bacterium]
MKVLALRFALALGALVALLGASAGAATAGPLGHVVPALDGAASSAEYTPHRDNYVILQAWETRRLHELKAANPNVKVLVYKDLAFSGPGAGSDATSASGVGVSEAPEAWFLKNTGGRKFTSEAYEWLWAMDVGSAAYQQRWYENVIGEVESAGWDGVFIDDANASMKYAYDPAKVAKYPNDASYAAAMEAALAYIGPKVQARGKLAIANFAQWVEAPQTYNRWLGYLSGGLDEMFVKWGRGAGEGYRPAYQWEAQVEEAEYAAAKGKVFIGFTQGAVGETQAARYGYASVLLGGDESASYAFTPNYTEETWLPEYEYEIGAATGAETADADGVHRRRFEAGLVLVNPTAAAQSVSFGGTYSGSGLEDATGATMPAHSALILTGSAAAAAPEATAPAAPTAPIRPPGPKSPAPLPIAVDVTVGEHSVELAWTPPQNSGTVSYQVVKNRRKVASTRKRRSRVGGIARRRASALEIVGYDGRGRIVARSKTFRVRGAAQPAKSRSYKVL